MKDRVSKKQHCAIATYAILCLHKPKKLIQTIRNLRTQEYLRYWKLQSIILDSMNLTDWENYLRQTANNNARVVQGPSKEHIHYILQFPKRISKMCVVHLKLQCLKNLCSREIEDVLVP